MKAISVESVGIRQSDQKEIIRAFIVADDTPATLPASGADVKGMSAEQVFAPFSILYVVANVEVKLYVADESGAFVAQ